MALSDGLQAHYKFEGDATDSTSNGNDATLSGDASFTSSSFDAQALTLDGSGDYASTSSFLNYDQDWTLAIWVKTTTTNQDVIIDERDANWVGPWININDPSSSSGCISAGVGYGGDGAKVVGSTVVDDGEWHHVALRYTASNTTIELFVDGSSEGTGTTDGTHNPNDVLGIGVKSGGISGGVNNDQYLNGDVDEFRGYNRALSSSEIDELSTITVVSWKDSADWDFSKSGSGVVHKGFGDLSGSGEIQLGYKTSDENGSSLESYWITDDNSATTIYDQVGANDLSVNGVTLGATGLNNTTTGSYDGSDDYLQGSDSSSLSADVLGTLTWSVWFYPKSTGGQTLVHKRNEYGIMYDRGGNKDINFFTYGDHIYAGTSGLATDQWHHVVVSWNVGTDVSIWVDGTQHLANATYTNTPDTTSNTFEIGVNEGSSGGLKYPMNGRIEDVRLYSRESSDSDAQLLYDTGTKGSLTTATKSFASSKKPDLTNLSYNLNGESIDVTVTGSPSSSTPESHTVTLDGASTYTISWSNAHTNFELTVEPSSTSVTSSPTFSSAELTEEKLVTSQAYTTSASSSPKTAKRVSKIYWKSNSHWNSAKSESGVKHPNDVVSLRDGWKETWEDGSADGWTVHNSNYGISSSPSRDSYSFGGSDNSGSATQLAETTIKSGGTQPSQIVAYWQEDGGSWGGGIRFKNSNGNWECGAGSNNPQWMYDSGSGVSEFFSGDGYNRWIKFKFTFDWSNGTFDIYGEDLSSGSTSSATGLNLKKGADIESIHLDEANGTPNYWLNGGSGGDCVMWFDDITVGMPSNSGSLTTDTSSFSSTEQPDLNDLKYALNQGSADLTVTGSPSSSTPESHTVTLDGSSSYTISWSNSHSNFEVDLSLSRTSTSDTSPSIDTVMLDATASGETSIVTPTESAATPKTSSPVLSVVGGGVTDLSSTTLTGYPSSLTTDLRKTTVTASTRRGNPGGLTIASSPAKSSASTVTGGGLARSTSYSTMASGTVSPKSVDPFTEAFPDGSTSSVSLSTYSSTPTISGTFFGTPTSASGSPLASTVTRTITDPASVKSSVASPLGATSNVTVSEVEPTTPIDGVSILEASISRATVKPNPTTVTVTPKSPSLSMTLSPEPTNVSVIPLNPTLDVFLSVSPTGISSVTRSGTLNGGVYRASVTPTGVLLSPFQTTVFSESVSGSLSTSASASTSGSSVVTSTTSEATVTSASTSTATASSTMTVSPSVPTASASASPSMASSIGNTVTASATPTTVRVYDRGAFDSVSVGTAGSVTSGSVATASAGSTTATTGGGVKTYNPVSPINGQVDSATTVVGTVSASTASPRVPSVGVSTTGGVQSASADGVTARGVGKKASSTVTPTGVSASPQTVDSLAESEAPVSKTAVTSATSPASTVARADVDGEVVSVTVSETEARLALVVGATPSTASATANQSTPVTSLTSGGVTGVAASPTVGEKTVAGRIAHVGRSGSDSTQGGSRGVNITGGRRSSSSDDGSTDVE